MDNDVVGRILIDSNLSSYKKFFDHDWSKDIFVAAEGTTLESAVTKLVISWRAANGAHVLPWFMVEQLKRLTLSLIDGEQRFRVSHARKYIRDVVNKLEGKMECHLSVDQRLALRRAVKSIENDASEALKTAVESDVGDKYWRLLIDQSEFQFCILGIQGITYASLYFAYEDFLQNVVRTTKPTYDSKSNDLGKALSEVLDKSVYDICWDGEVELARLVRNALVHNGGTFSGKMDKFQSRFVKASETETTPIQGKMFILVDEIIQITPDNTTYLFGVLRDRVSRIVEHVTRFPLLIAPA